MGKYRFDRLSCTIPGFEERDHIIQAQSLTDAVTKFTRKHELQPPAYWDEPAFDRSMELVFAHEAGKAAYRISW